MTTNRIVVLAAAGLMVLDLLWLLIRIKKNGVISKEQRTKKFYAQFFSGYALAVCLLVIMLFREFGLIGDCVLAGCCVLGAEVENKMLLGTTDMWDEDSAQ